MPRYGDVTGWEPQEPTAEEELERTLQMDDYRELQKWYAAQTAVAMVEEALARPRREEVEDVEF